VKTTEGFEFLGFSFKTYSCSWHHSTLPRSHYKARLSKTDPNCVRRGTTYYSRPSKNAVIRQKTKVKEFMKEHKTSPIGDIVRGLSLITGG
jgi:hypothetical protein